MTTTATRLKTFAALGLANGARVLAYRLGLKSGVHPVLKISATIPEGKFFVRPSSASPAPGPAPMHWRHESLLFGTYRFPIGQEPPPWTIDPMAQGVARDPAPETMPPWWRIGDFSGGDIKRIWELSRFDWVLAFAQQARAGEAGAIERLNAWLADWSRANPPYRGPNWKCAQEASIRLMHLSLAALILEEDSALTPPMRAMIDAHVRRIVPTLSYAQAQDNNHATSEAAALFVAGIWLERAGESDSHGLAARGRHLLEKHCERLFAPDGSFSQYSVNYHRVALDTLSIAELWRRHVGATPFGTRFRQRAAVATEWLRAMVDPNNGDAPNLGANDGANLLPLIDADYRDHRSSVQLAAALFLDARAYEPGPWDGVAEWLGTALPEKRLEPPVTTILDDGGYAIIRAEDALALLRYPRFRFRPSQADALHLDLWVDGRNLLRDGGSYSYNTDAKWIDYFGGIRSHNGIEFDGRPQMPRLSRFLLGDWLKTDSCGSTKGGFAASYRHREGWYHKREAELGASLRVIDTVGGFAKGARLRWRLSPGEWRVDGNSVTNGLDRLSVKADVPLVSFELVTGWESRHYLEKTELPVLEVVIDRPGRIISEYLWTS